MAPLTNELRLATSCCGRKETVECETAEDDVAVFGLRLCGTQALEAQPWKLRIAGFATNIKGARLATGPFALSKHAKSQQWNHTKRSGSKWFNELIGFCERVQMQLHTRSFLLVLKGPCAKMAMIISRFVTGVQKLKCTWSEVGQRLAAENKRESCYGNCYRSIADRPHKTGSIRRCRLTEVANSQLLIDHTKLDRFDVAGCHVHRSKVASASD